MAIYFVQHGEALPKDVDPERGLSETGIGSSEKAAAHLTNLQHQIKKICHSEKKRALQTAEIFAQALGDCEISQSSGMGPKDDVLLFAENITDNTIYVGHLPHLGKLISYLLTENEDADVVKVTNSGIICLDICDSGYQLLWYLNSSLT